MAKRGSIQRFAAACLVLLCGPMPRPVTGAGASRIAVVSDGRVEAFAETVTGIVDALKGASIDVLSVDVQRPSRDSELQVLTRPDVSAVIAIGSESLRLSARQRLAVPLVTAMVAEPDRREMLKTSGSKTLGVVLNFPLSPLLDELVRVFPKARRVGIIRNPLREVSDVNAAAKAPVAIRVTDCIRPEDLFPALQSLKGQVDFVVVLPDGALYNSATVPPFILRALENRLPVVAFSSAFVRSGAAFGMFTDHRDIGTQTALLTLRLLAGGRAIDETPRRWVFAVNQRVVRLLGLEHESFDRRDLVVFR